MQVQGAAEQEGRQQTSRELVIVPLSPCELHCKFVQTLYFIR